MSCLIFCLIVALLSINEQKHLASKSLCYLEAGARRIEGERSGGSTSWKIWQGAQERFVPQFLGLYPQYQKSVGTAKTDPAKAAESASTKLHSQVSFSAQLPQNIKFHWLIGALDSF